MTRHLTLEKNACLDINFYQHLFSFFFAGVAYIKYAKTSEAAVAMEEMNGKFIGNNAKSLKVLIANSRDQGSKREMNEEERLLRLFIIVPKSMSETELKEHFAQFGDVEHCNVVRDRNTKESKGYAYVKFHR